MIESKPRIASTEEVVAELRKRAGLRDGQPREARRRHAGRRTRAGPRAQAPRQARALLPARSACRAICAFLPDAQFVSRDLPADLPADTLWVFCDMSDCARAGEFLPPIERENMLDIDHHLGNSHFGALNYVLPNGVLDRNVRHASAARARRADRRGISRPAC